MSYINDLRNALNYCDDEPLAGWDNDYTDGYMLDHYELLVDITDREKLGNYINRQRKAEGLRPYPCDPWDIGDEEHCFRDGRFTEWGYVYEK